MEENEKITKICTQCKKPKSFCEFHKDASKKYGLASHCKTCSKEWRRRYYDKNKERILEKQKEYVETHKDIVCERKRRWYQNNEERLREKNRAWASENKEQAKKNHHRWREKNREHVRQVGKNWRENNRLRDRELKREYKKRNPQTVINDSVRRRTLIGEFFEVSGSEWRQLMSNYNWKCFYCLVSLTSKNRTLDHIIPISKGGRHHINNLIPCCRSCNCSKQSSIYPAWKGMISLDHMRRYHLMDRLKKEAVDCLWKLQEKDDLEQLLFEINRELS